jgi:hypothetical protein
MTATADLETRSDAPGLADGMSLDYSRQINRS